MGCFTSLPERVRICITGFNAGSDSVSVSWKLPLRLVRLHVAELAWLFCEVSTVPFLVLAILGSCSGVYDFSYTSDLQASEQCMTWACGAFQQL